MHLHSWSGPHEISDSRNLQEDSDFYCRPGPVVLSSPSNTVVLNLLDSKANIQWPSYLS